MSDKLLQTEQKKHIADTNIRQASLHTHTVAKYRRPGAGVVHQHPRLAADEHQVLMCPTHAHTKTSEKKDTIRANRRRRQCRPPVRIAWRARCRLEQRDCECQRRQGWRRRYECRRSIHRCRRPYCRRRWDYMSTRGCRTNQRPAAGDWCRFWKLCGNTTFSNGRYG